MSKSLLNRKKDRPWEIWKDNKKYCDYLIKRANGKLDLMESNKILVKFLKPIYKESFKLLDVCCSAGHYLRGLKQLNPDVRYYGVDNVKYLIDAAKEIFKQEKNAHFKIGDIYDLGFEDKSMDIVFCFNTLQNLPDFKSPLKELLRVTKRYCFVRMLIGDKSYRIQEKLDERNICHHNIYKIREIEDFIFTLDNFDVKVIEEEFKAKLTGDKNATRIIDGMQVLGNIIYPWKVLKIKRA